MDPTNNATQVLTFAVSTDGTADLTISHPAGPVIVQGGDQPHIVLSRAAGDTTYDDLPGEVNLAEVLDIRQEGNAVRIKPIPVPPEWQARLRHLPIREMDGEALAWERIRRAPCMALDVRVPHQCAVTVHTASGDVVVGMVQGTVAVHTASGNTALSAITGPVAVNSASGAVGVREVRGRLVVNTASGDLGIQQSALSALKVDTVSGSVAAQVAWQPDGAYAFHTISGDVTLMLPGDTGATVDFQTLSGGFQCALPHQRIHGGGRRQVSLNGGGPVHIDIHTLSGSARIQASSSLSTPAPATPADPAAPDAMAILAAIEQGDLSVDDGLRQLSALAN